jgi:hypothetical protein
MARGLKCLLKKNIILKKHTNKIMKITIYLVLICTLFLSNSGCARAQNDKQAVQMLKEFYNAHNTVWSTTKDNYILIRKLDSLQRKYCTMSLRRELKKEFQANGLDHDILTNDYDINIEALKTMSISKDPTKPKGYIVSWTISTLNPSYKPIKKKVFVHVTVVKENNSSKINSVS